MTSTLAGLEIVVVDADARWADLVGTVLGAEGHRVRHVTDPGELRRGNRRSPDVVIGDIDLPGEGLGRDALPGGAVVLLTSTRPVGEAAVTARAAALQAHKVLRKPVSLLDLADLLRAIARERRSAAPPAPPTPVVARSVLSPSLGRSTSQSRDRNLALLVRLIGEARSGLLELDDGGAPLRLSAGGLLEQAGGARLLAAVDGATWSFTDRSSTGRGDVGALAAALWGLARDGSANRFAAEHRFDALVRTPYTDVAAHLPISEGLRTLLFGADGRTPLGEALVERGLKVDACTVELQALVRLRVVDLQPPRAQAPAARPAGGLAARMPLADESLLPSRGSAVERGPRVEGLGSTRSIQPSSSARSIGSGSRSGGDLVSDVRSDVRSPSALRSNSDLRSDIRSVHGRSVDVVALQQRLRKEVDELKDAPAAVVLGVPSNASPELVEAAAERLRKRYGDLAQGPQLPAALRQLGQEMLTIVDGAFHRFVRGRADELRSRREVERAEDFEASVPVATDEDLAVEKAEVLFRKGAFAEADRLLHRSHQRRIDHVGVLAALGWARLHNPGVEAAKRDEEGREYLLLAEQLDPLHARGQRYLAEYLKRKGDLTGGLRRAQRAAKADPGDPDVARLLRELRPHP